MRDFYTKRLLPYAQSLARCNYKSINGSYSLNIDDLSEFDQGEFAMNLLELDEYDLSCISDNKNAENIICLMRNMLINSTYESKVDFSSEIRESIIEFYKPKMQEIIDECIESIESCDRFESGYVKKQYQDNGEHYWGQL